MVVWQSAGGVSWTLLDVRFSSVFQHWVKLNIFLCTLIQNQSNNLIYAATYVTHISIILLVYGLSILLYLSCFIINLLLSLFKFKNYI